MATGPASATLEVTVVNVLGYKREEDGGGSLLLEVEIGGTVHEICRLVFPNEAVIAGVRTFLAKASTTPTADGV